jgi:hypothetical protein
VPLDVRVELIDEEVGVISFSTILEGLESVLAWYGFQLEAIG